MNSKIKLISLGATMAIALLPTQARGNVPILPDDTDGQPSALTSVEALPDLVLDIVPEEVVPEAIAADANQETQAPSPAAVEPVNTNAQPSALGLPSSTNSSDLQPIESPLSREGLFQTPLVQPLDIAQTASESSPSGVSKG